jgi:hypothetical protein
LKGNAATLSFRSHLAHLFSSGNSVSICYGYARPSAAMKRRTVLNGPALQTRPQHNTTRARTTLHNLRHVTTRHNRVGGLH